MKNGELWFDSTGNLINAHGGGILSYCNCYYWYGEHKREGYEGRLAFDGVHCYKSNDLVHWVDCGIVLPVSEDPISPIFSGCRIERPKVIFNKVTSRFIMYFHSTDKNHTIAKRGLAISESPIGPFKFLNSSRVNAGYWPLNVNSNEMVDDLDIPPESAFGNGEDPQIAQYNIFARDRLTGQMARDMTLFVDDDNIAYHIYSSEHNSTLHIAELTDDYLGWTGRFVRVFPNCWNEGVALFKHKNKYYLLASGCTSWEPNSARAAVADNIFGPWMELPNPCLGINPHNGFGPERTFGGQSTFVFSAGNVLIAMFDFWNATNFMESRYCWLNVQITESGYIIPWKDTFQVGN